MSGKKISSGVVHEIPQELSKMLIADAAVLELWEDITPLARNEWLKIWGQSKNIGTSPWKLLPYKELLKQ